MSAQLNINLEFTPRRRDDIDFLFLAANADQARLLVPQLRFFQAHDLALYATSYVYSGKPDPAVDADLDGIIFGDMNWILDAAVLPEPEPAPALTFEAETDSETAIESRPLPDGQPETETAAALEGGAEPVESPPPLVAAQPPSGRETDPYYHTDLDRLYALGLDSYPLISGLKALRSNQGWRYFGKAVDLSVRTDGNIWRHLTWARFERGMPVPLPGITTVDILAPTPGLVPLPTPLPGQ